LISSTGGWIFGGYTPLAWSSRGSYVADPSLTSFLFTIKNPHDLEAQIFKQKQEGQAIYDNGSCGPGFGCGTDIAIWDRCHSSDGSWSNLGGTYTNDTGIAGKQVFTGSYNFTVEEIEVFQVI
jgi:hypothetical protein